MDAHVRCLFCETGKEPWVVNAIRTKGWGEAIFAQRVKEVWRNGAWAEVNVPLMPGYVFVYATEEEERGAGYGGIEHVIRLLKYNDGREVLEGADLAFAEWLYGIDGKVGKMQAIREGEKVKIVDGVFRALHGTVVRMNRRRRKMCVLIEMQGHPVQIWLSYELVDKEKEEEKTEAGSAGKTPPGEKNG